MSFLDKLTAFLPIKRKEEKQEYFFAANIGIEQITVALWTISGKELKIAEIASDNYSSQDEIVVVLDKLLDSVIGLKEIEPQKILFGVPHSWILDDNLKEEYLKILRNIIKELELSPMAYVSESNALINFLEKKEGVPPTAILVGFEKNHLSVIVMRAGKLDGVKIVKRGESAGFDIEKALLTFTDVETLPSKILIYGDKADELKTSLLPFSWMAKLSFLHFPKIEVLEEDLPIKSVCLAGGSEMNESISYTEQSGKPQAAKVTILDEKDASKPEPVEEKEKKESSGDFGFVVGDIAEQKQEEETQELVVNEPAVSESLEEPPALAEQSKVPFNIKKFIPKKLTTFIFPLIGVAVLIILFLGYLFLAKADIKIFVEPKILEKDATVTADPDQKTVNEVDRIIPGQIVTVEVSGSGKDSATGKKQIGDPAKGTVVIINNTDQGQNFSSGTVLVTTGGLKFKLNNTASVSATLSDVTSKSTKTVEVTAVDIGADSNIASETNLKIGNFATSQFVAKTQGNFSGGTSKDVTVVSSDDAARLLAKLSSDLKQQAQQKLQEKYPDKKILQEALLEGTVKKSYSKNINDQAGEFSLNMSISYKGTAFNDADLKTIVSQLVTTQVPDGFQLDLSGTETQADVSKLEKTGKLIFLAKFKARMMPRLDTEKIKKEIKFKSQAEAADIIKNMANVLGSEIKMTPNLPAILSRLPVLLKNITIEVRLK
ncbi:MAG: hypothetical protein Q7R77_03490 [Candidatus Daviesbacteria bacterium]|nr:hypothetical protein [Candidatus Daviesbacteria bacterium]